MRSLKIAAAVAPMLAIFIATKGYFFGFKSYHAVFGAFIGTVLATYIGHRFFVLPREAEMEKKFQEILETKRLANAAKKKSGQ